MDRARRDATPATPALEMEPEAFRRLGHELVDTIADFLESVPRRPAAPDVSPRAVRKRIESERTLPEAGSDPGALLRETAPLLFEGCRLNGHPRSWGYIIGTPAPLGILADFLAAAVNPNLTAWASSPVPSEIEAQTIRWLAAFLGYPETCGGLLVSGGNMANFVGLLCARRAKAGWDLRRDGLAAPQAKPLTLYASAEVHTWLHKAADLFGLGTGAIREVPCDDGQRLRLDALVSMIEADRAAGARPFLVIGSAGTVSTGAVDPLPEIAAIAREHDLWFHVDGAYGAPAVAAHRVPAELAGLREADSLAVDGHKWLYQPLEAGCVLVRDAAALPATFAYRPAYYHDPVDPAEAPLNYYQLGPQNSRCFRALKLWLGLRCAGAAGYRAMIERDIETAEALAGAVAAEPELELATRNLSIATFRFVPEGLDAGAAEAAGYLNALNQALLTRVLKSGEAFLSNAVIGGRFVLRACITNFRTQAADIAALPEIVTRHGRALDAEMRPAALR
ncbi:MAG TPA: aminotransferase class V-fold PLP-dependent enzyme [Kiloniellales bacterium]|nr:aminotransferase class V-fold PLP-dependent enzyme [Kiloniellales bacterium]